MPIAPLQAFFFKPLSLDTGLVTNSIKRMEKTLRMAQPQEATKQPYIHLQNTQITKKVNALDFYFFY